MCCAPSADCPQSVTRRGADCHAYGGHNERFEHATLDPPFSSGGEKVSSLCEYLFAYSVQLRPVEWALCRRPRHFVLTRPLCLGVWPPFFGWRRCTRQRSVTKAETERFLVHVPTIIAEYMLRAQTSRFSHRRGPDTEYQSRGCQLRLLTCFYDQDSKEANAVTTPRFGVQGTNPRTGQTAEHVKGDQLASITFDKFIKFVTKASFRTSL